jgi:rare lipoprotein A
MANTVWRLASCSALALLVANCASQAPGPRQQLSAQNAREIGAFSDSRKYGRASPRVVSHDQSVPKGGGRDHVGRPYRINGRWYTPRDNPSYTATGNSSWYGDAFHGRKTANGEVYDKHAYTAAHPTMPLPSYARVTNTHNGRSIVVRVNDRGPYHGGRIIDVSERVAHALDFKSRGTARVQVDYLRRASVAGSDDRMLFASLRTDGGAADLPGGSRSPAPERPNILLASNTQPTPVAQPAVASTPAIASRTVFQPQPAAQVQPAAVSTPAPVARSVPLPQERPFDLDAIPGADRQIERVNNGQGQRTVPQSSPQPLPGELRAQAPASPDRQRTAALYFASPTGMASGFNADDPMRRLKPGFAPIAHKPIGQSAPIELQAGVFREKANAERVKQVLAKHAAVTVREAGAGEQRRFVVSAAGFNDRAQADKALAALASAGIRDARLISR